MTAIEHEWYSEHEERVLCVLVEDTTDQDYVCIVLGRDRVGRYRAVHLSDFYESIQAVRRLVPELLADWASRDAREYEQGDEPRRQMDFFTPRHPVQRLNTTFAKLLNDEAFSPARGIVESMMFYFEDPDGNFVEQFQSTAFNARLWELYLFAVLAEDRCLIDRTYPAPDYLFTGVFGQGFIEAVTVNPNESVGEAGYPNDPTALGAYLKDYLPVKFAGPLTNKLQRAYWQEPHINQRPIILAIADFHCQNSMARSQDSLLAYLYGRWFTRRYDRAGRLSLTSRPIIEHVWGTKHIPSGFFNLPNAEHVAAVISTGEETILKFNRMGKRAGFGSSRLRMNVSGLRCVDHPRRARPQRFELDVRSRQYEEYWVDGLHIYHNPRALRPLDIRILSDGTHHFFKNRRLESIHVDRSPFQIQTRVTLSDTELDLSS